LAVTKTCYKVVIASPSDVVSERETTLEAINIINESFKKSTAFLEPYMWETDADPSFHPKGPQGIIDEALNIENSDIFIGIFYLKFGTPAIGSDSGTVHEVRQAIEANERNNTPEIKLYFKIPSKNDLSALNEYNLKQYESVDPILTSADMILAVINPQPVELEQNKDKIEILLYLKKEGYPIEFVINFYNNGINRKELSRYLKTTLTIFISAINPEYIYEAGYKKQNTP